MMIARCNDRKYCRRLENAERNRKEKEELENCGGLLFSSLGVDDGLGIKTPESGPKAI